MDKIVGQWWWLMTVMLVWMGVSLSLGAKTIFFDSDVEDQ